MSRFFTTSRFSAFACAIVASLLLASREPARSAPAPMLETNAGAAIVDFSSLKVRGTADLYAKLVALPKNTRIGFGGKVTTAGLLLDALRRHPLAPTRHPTESKLAAVSIVQLNSPTVMKRTNVSAMQTAIGDLSKAIIPLPPTQSSLPDGPSICGKHTLCATFFPTYQTTQSPCDGMFGALECEPIPPACSYGSGTPCPQATATPAPNPVVLGGCTPNTFAAQVGIPQDALPDCAWNPVQTADVTIADSFAFDFYEKSADCDANGFLVEVKSGADDGVARTLHMRITQPNPPQQPLAQAPSATMAVCAITVYIVGPKGQTWQF
jgi:hypothetical protein